MLMTFKTLLKLDEFKAEAFIAGQVKPIILASVLKASWKHIRGNTFTETHSEIHSQKHIRISNYIN